MRLQRIYVGLMATLAVALLARPLIRAADQSSWSIGIGAVATVATVLAVTAAAWVFRIRRVGLVVSFVVAGVLWLGATVMMSAAPVAAVACNLLAFPFALAPLLHIERSHRHANPRDALVDTLTLIVPGLLIVWSFTTAQPLARGGLGPTEVNHWILQLTSLAMLGVVARIATVAPVGNVAVRYLLGSMGLVVLQDTLGWRYPGGALEGPVWLGLINLASWSLLGLFALHPSVTEVTEPERVSATVWTSRTTVLLGGAALVVPLVLLFGPPHSRVSDLPIALTSMACGGLILYRMGSVVRSKARASAGLAELADQDALTGLGNRRSSDALLDRLIAAADPSTALNVVLIDLDWFKAYNDEHGHQGGDLLLRECASRWTNLLPRGATLTRYGGEEFLVIDPDASIEGTATLIETFRHALPPGRTFSAGISRWSPGEHRVALVDRADQALYAAKTAGRATTRVSGKDLPAFAPPIAPEVRRHRDDDHLAFRVACLLTVLIPLGFLFAPWPLARQLLYGSSILLVVLGFLRALAHGLQLSRIGIQWSMVLVTFWVALLVAQLSPQVALPGLSITLVESLGVVSHVLVIPTIIALFRPWGRGFEPDAWLDTVIIILPMGLVGWVLANSQDLPARQEAASNTPWVMLAYAATSLVIVSLVTQLILPNAFPPMALRMLGWGATFEFFADMAALMLPEHRYPLDTGWGFLHLLAMVCIAAGLVHPSVRLLGLDTGTRHRNVVLEQFAVLGAAAAAPGIVLILQAFVLDRSFDTLVGIVSAILVGLLITRLRIMMAGLNREVRELELAASTDHLTGLPNRRTIDAHLAALCAVTQPGGTLEDAVPKELGPAVAMLDLDRFKAFNDRFGHPRGDELLHGCALAWSAILDPGQQVGRHGGEEFLLIVERADADTTLAVIAALREVMPHGQNFSAGVAIWDGQESTEHLLGRADAALYQAKANGRGRSEVASGRTPTNPVSGGATILRLG